ncbi:hypothetical protein [Thermococcus chitonophagus]|uniref:ABC-type multidrug transport system, permease component n=1 Tax=Thermococcus chitonophagus TaxID=54262 RepID=A0A160VSI1_9EURY|nr:hypothetical protein [Thermococcus chitonophagus]CUX77790.1 ABC-type multidrug transport system, permease component [Thermococcus chitonophagus]
MIRTLISLELKGMRMYLLYIIVSMVLMPASFLIVMILNMKSVSAETLAYLISGFIVASFVGTFIGTLAQRVSNVFDPSVLELYATFPATIRQIVLTIFGTYIILALPQTVIALVFLFYYSSVNIGLLLLALILTVLEMGGLGIFLGLAVRNPYKVQAVVAVLPWVLIVFSPTYYKASSSVFLLDPVTSLLNVLRTAVGVGVVDTISLAIPIILTAILWGYIYRNVQTSYMLEKPF